MVPFIELARRRGVERLVLAQQLGLRDGWPGRRSRASGPRARQLRRLRRVATLMVHAERNRWHFLARMIRDEDRIVTAAGEARIGFVDADDIAAVAVHALLDETRPATD